MIDTDLKSVQDQSDYYIFWENISQFVINIRGTCKTPTLNHKSITYKIHQSTSDTLRLKIPEALHHKTI
jgi:phage terminase large subunit